MFNLSNRSKIKTAIVAMGSVFMLYSCGEPLPESGGTTATSAVGPKKIYSIEEAFEIVAKENDVARKLYTKGIVGPGKKNGIKFDEDWRKEDVEAGPLPALFLRGISSYIQKTDVPLGLYLGSDFPINSANEFTGMQADLFKEVKSTEKPKFFFDEESKLQTSMFPDFAAAAPCVNCHNDHPETKKSDWKLGDVMGATTWTYPSDSVTFEELQDIIMAYRKGAMATLEEFHEEIANYKESEKPEIGEMWPSDGLYIPSAEAFMDSVQILVADKTLAGILKL